MEFKELLILIFVVNALFIIDLYFFHELFFEREDKPSAFNETITVQEDYEEVQVDEFDSRIEEMKKEIKEKKSTGVFEVNEAEVITEEYEQHLYHSIE
jgi:hypothetical protein